jgi:hypothetical protein
LATIGELLRLQRRPAESDYCALKPSPHISCCQNAEDRGGEISGTTTVRRLSSHEFSGFRLYACILGSHSFLSFKNPVPVFIGQVRISSGGRESDKVDRSSRPNYQGKTRGEVRIPFLTAKAITQGAHEP